MTAQQSSGGQHNGSLTYDGTKSSALPAVCKEIHTRVTAFLSSDPGTERLRRVQEQSKTSLRVIKEALQQYSLEELSLSYNGGKDCLVLLILYLSALHERLATAATAHTSPFIIPPTLHTVYIISKHPFKEVDDFVDESARTYCLDLARYAKSMKEAFSDYLADHRQVKAIFVGTRRTDPHGADLKHFDPTDRGWPAFMRVHPVIDWHYAEVWAFIRALNIPYCTLYDLGYTSLGGTTDTYPNPMLKTVAVAGSASFKPAYELIDDEEERLGRPQ